VNRAGLRRAAVLVAGMHRSDRRWIRKQLAGNVWRSLERAMDELRRVSRMDRQLIGQMLPATDGMPAPEPPPPDVLMAGLDGLSPDWASLVLDACAPDHRAMYDASRRTGGEPADGGRSVPERQHVPPALASCLAEVVRRRGQRAIAGAEP
jgi:hypothetical protein